MDMAIRIAKKFPTIDFYGYTKLGNVSKKGVPNNFYAKLSTHHTQHSAPEIKPIDFEQLLNNEEEMPAKK
jgi:hypothetical protein